VIVIASALALIPREIWTIRSDDMVLAEAPIGEEAEPVPAIPL
jgi:hypothetical protein